MSANFQIALQSVTGSIDLTVGDLADIAQFGNDVEVIRLKAAERLRAKKAAGVQCAA